MSIQEKRNSELFLRPRFSIDLKENHENILNRFNDLFENGATSFRGTIVDHHIFISVPKKDEHFWSPQLDLEILENKENTSQIKGLFGPKSEVWTLFMFVHFLVGVSFLAFCMLLYTRISLKESVFLPTVMLIVLPLIWILFYFLGKLGKEKGKQQMKQLHDFMIKNI